MLQMSYINDFPLNTQGVKLVLFVDHTNMLVVDKNELLLKEKKKFISYERIRDMASKNLSYYKY
jgi:hypothetical protein